MDMDNTEQTSALPLAMASDKLGGGEADQPNEAPTSEAPEPAAAAQPVADAAEPAGDAPPAPGAPPSNLPDVKATHLADEPPQADSEAASPTQPRQGADDPGKAAASAKPDITSPSRTELHALTWDEQLRLKEEQEARERAARKQARERAKKFHKATELLLRGKDPMASPEGAPSPNLAAASASSEMAAVAAAAAAAAATEPTDDPELAERLRLAQAERERIKRIQSQQKKRRRRKEKQLEAEQRALSAKLEEESRRMREREDELVKQRMARLEEQRQLRERRAEQRQRRLAQLHDEERKLMPSTPLYKRMEQQFEERVVMPELEARKKRLSELHRVFQMPSKDELVQHDRNVQAQQRLLKEREIAVQRRVELRQRQVDGVFYRGAARELVERELSQKQEAEQAEKARRREQRLRQREYAKQAQEQHRPKPSDDLKKELVTRLAKLEHPKRHAESAQTAHEQRRRAPVPKVWRRAKSHSQRKGEEVLETEEEKRQRLLREAKHKSTEFLRQRAERHGKRRKHRRKSECSEDEGSTADASSPLAAAKERIKMEGLQRKAARLEHRAKLQEALHDESTGALGTLEEAEAHSKATDMYIDALKAKVELLHMA